MQELEIIDLDANSVFLDTVAERVWKEWWKHKGKTLQDVYDGVLKAITEKPYCGGFVAIQDGLYLGSALIIESDLKERPNLTPWLAAVYVEPQHRKKGIGSELVKRATSVADNAGKATLYLCATQKNAAYYKRLGWAVVEESVGQQKLTILTKSTVSEHRQS